jgi:sporadic carbohydrate cluster 2OG-Fe(II) oxygenase
MFVIPQKKSLYLIKKFSQIKNLTLKKIESLARPHYVELEVPFGKAVLFSHSILHGNSINREDQTRWSLNVRFKSLLSPYGSKNLGESFNPIIIRPMTSHGYNYVEYNLGR